MENSKNRSGCLISCSLDAIGDKWSLLIVRDLMFAKQCTYGDFMKADEKIATNILASRLKTLEEHDIIQKLQHPESKAKVLYQLTQKGIDLLPIIVELNLWAEKYYTGCPKKNARIQELKNDKEGFIKRTKSALKQTQKN